MTDIWKRDGDPRSEPVIRDSDGDWTPAPWWMQAWPVVALVLAVVFWWGL
jgi:hypothetical protein